MQSKTWYHKKWVGRQASFPLRWCVNFLSSRLFFYDHLCILRSWVSRCRQRMVFFPDLDKALVCHHPYHELSNSMFLRWLFLLSSACISSCLARFRKPVQILPHLFFCKIKTFYHLCIWNVCGLSSHFFESGAMSTQTKSPNPTVLSQGDLASTQ